MFDTLPFRGISISNHKQFSSESSNAFALEHSKQGFETSPIEGRVTQHVVQQCLGYGCGQLRLGNSQRLGPCKTAHNGQASG
jgi:hypothetical protein